MIQNIMAKKCFTLVCLFFICSVCSTHTVMGQTNMNKKEAGQTLKLMTYNLKFASPTYVPSWEIRREMQVALIRQYAPDILGTQEGLKEQIDYLADQLPEYVVIGEGRKGGDDDEHMAIFFRRDKFRLREMQSFQLSATPEIIGSGPEVNPRMVTWARLALTNRPKEGEKSAYPQDYRGHWDNNREIYVFNTHYFNGPDAALSKLNASRLILKRINALNRFGEWEAERPLFLMGDFNCRPGTPPYRILVGDKNSTDPDLLKNTFEDVNKIDWILYKGNVNVLKYEEVTYNVNGVYPSDHKPIYVEVELPGK
jgi:endonuclease/exonuclease/phosphatase family metal-dependent hydrolase